MSRMAFLTRVFAFSHVVPPSLSSDGRERARVLLDEVEPLDRDEQLVVAGVAELHELLRLEADVDPLQADEHADAVVDVDDEIAGLEIAEVREKRARRGAPALVDLALLLEDVGLRPELQRRFGQPEPARQVAGADQHRCRVRVLGPLDRDREHVVVGEQLDRALGAAGRVRDEDDRVAAARASRRISATQSGIRPPNSSAG